MTGGAAGLGGLEAQENTSLTVGSPLMDIVNLDNVHHQYTVTDVATYEDLIHAHAGYIESTAGRWGAAIGLAVSGILLIIAGIICLAFSSVTSGAGLFPAFLLIMAGVSMLCASIPNLDEGYRQIIKEQIITNFTTRKVFAPYIRPIDPYITESYISELNNAVQIVVGQILLCINKAYNPTCAYIQEALRIASGFDFQGILSKYGLDSGNQSALLEFGATVASLIEKLSSNTVLTADDIAFGIRVTDVQFADLQIGFI